MDFQSRDQPKEREADIRDVARASDLPMAKCDVGGSLQTTGSDDPGLVGVLLALQPIGDDRIMVATEHVPDQMGASEVLTADLRGGVRSTSAHLQETTVLVPSLVERLHDLTSVPKSRVTGDCHARFREGLGVQFPRPTRFFIMGDVGKGEKVMVVGVLEVFGRDGCGLATEKFGGLALARCR